MRNAPAYQSVPLKFCSATSAHALLAALFFANPTAPHASGASNAEFELTVPGAAPVFGNEAQNRELLRVWSNVPDYIRILKSDRTLKQQPRLTSSITPVYPAVLIPADGKVSVLMSLLINEHGDVEAARVVNSMDSRFNKAAIEAVLQWKFSPAESAEGPTKVFVSAPLIFQGTNWAANAIQLNVLPISYIESMQTGERFPMLKVEIGGPCAAQTKASRLVVRQASDDTGLALQARASHFLKTAVGSTSRADFAHQDVVRMEAVLSAASPSAQKIKMLNATAELVIPSLDPKAEAMIDVSPRTMGSPVSSEALRAAGVSLEIFDQRSYAIRQAEKRDQRCGLTEYGIGVYFDEAMLASLPPAEVPSFQSGGEIYELMRKQNPPPEMTVNDLALGISDPEGRLVAMEFLDAEGTPLIYNRNGWYHLTSKQGKRFDIYRLENGIPEGAKLTCWLLTAKSLVSIPVNLVDLPLAETLPPSAPAPLVP